MGTSSVRRAEKKVMVGSQLSPTTDGSARGSQPSNMHDSQQQRMGRPWGNHCAKPGRTKDTC